MKNEEVKSYLDQAWKLISQTEEDLEHHPILRSNNPKEIQGSIAKEFPHSSSKFEEVLSSFENQILPFLNHNADPRFGAYITGSGNKIAAIAEFIKGYFNQNGLKWNNSPIAAELEQLVIKWVAEYNKVLQHSKGVITSGGSMSNLMGIHFALASKYPRRETEGFYQQAPFTIYCSNQTHSSIDRAMVFLGLGRDYLRKIAVNERFEIDLEQLKAQIEKDIAAGFRPLMIVGNAGSTNTGSIDDLEGLAAIARAYDVWYHVDGAYGLPAIRLPELSEKFKGVEEADSIVINPHKWMYVTFEASCVLLKEIPEAIHFSPDYLFTEDPGLRWESSNHTIELSKEFRALKIWFTMKYFGAKQLTEFVEKDIRDIEYLAEQLRLLPNLDVEPHHPLSILCFRWSDDKLNDDQSDRVNVEAIRMVENRGEIFITGTKLNGQTYLRVYFGNPTRTKADIDRMVAEIQFVFKEISEKV